MCYGSFRPRTETISILVGDYTIGMHHDRYHVFLHFDCVFVFPLSVEKLLKSRHLVVNNLLLRLHFSFKNAISIFITNGRNSPLAKCIDVNAEPCANNG